MKTMIIFALIKHDSRTIAGPEWKISRVPSTPIRSGF